MRLARASCLTFLAVASASPIAIPEPADDNALTHLRFGLGAAGSKRSVNLEQLQNIYVPGQPPQGHWNPTTNTLPPNVYVSTPANPGQFVRRPCTGARAGAAGFKSRFREKSIEISNMFRQTFGMPLIKVEVVQTYEIKTGIPVPMRSSDFWAPFDGTSTPHPRPHRIPTITVGGGGLGGILPGNGAILKEGHGVFPYRESGRFPAGRGGHHHDYHHGEFRHGFRNNRMGGPFMVRLHNALMSLGPWEGRAVAFVLGCGIGVLIRMMWVLAVVAYRAVKGTSGDENEDSGYMRFNEDEVLDAEEIFVAPPQYFVDEKTPIPEEGKN